MEKDSNFSSPIIPILVVVKLFKKKKEGKMAGTKREYWEKWLEHL